MRRRIMAIGVVAAILISFSAHFTAQAAAPRLKLTFNGTEATCYVMARGNGPIEIVMSLWNRNTEIAAWSATGNGVIVLNKTVTVSMGETYTLKLNGSIAGTAFPEVSISRTNWEMNK